MTRTAALIHLIAHAPEYSRYLATNGNYWFKPILEKYPDPPVIGNDEGRPATTEELEELRRWREDPIYDLQDNPVTANFTQYQKNVEFWQEERNAITMRNNKASETQWPIAWAKAILEELDKDLSISFDNE
jgi:hypothetical protein